MHSKHALGVLIFFSALSLVAGDFGPWGAPVNLGAAINSGFGESSATTSKNGLSLYFQSNRPGVGGFDIYVSQRTSEDASWGPPVMLGPSINTTAGEMAPALSRDGHYLFFISDRAGGKGDFDLYVSYREFTHDVFSWQPAVPITELNTSLREGMGSYFENEGGRPQLYFAHGVPGNLDIYMTEQQADGTWGTPTPISELNTGVDDARPAIRFDGLEIVFFSNRGGDYDLYASHRNSVSDPWSAPENIGPAINSAAVEQQPSLSSDGTELYFASNRRGGFGLNDLYVTRRSKRGNHE